MKHARLLIMMLLLAFAVPAISFAATEEEEQIDIQQYVENMQPGWNLGNTFDAVGQDETAWGNPFVTQEFIENIADQGFNSIRIPVTFDQRMAEGPQYTIDEDFLSRLDQAISWSLDEELYVMINIHHDSWIWLEAGMQQNHDDSLARYEAIWTQLAERYKDYSINLMFESINEPRFQSTTEEEKQQYLDELNAAFYDIVRSSGGNNDVRPLVLPTLDTGSDQHKIDGLRTFIDELDDPNIIATVHYYGFWPFSVNIAGFTTFNEETKNDIISTFDRVYENFVEDGIPVVIGEYGLLGFDTDLYAIHHGEKLKFFEYMIHYAQEKQLTHMLWDNGQHFGRTSYQWSDQELFDMMHSSWTTRSATADVDSIFIKRNTDIEDTAMALQLNGNTFTALKHNDANLVAGEDYELNENVLTLKAGLLEELTSPGTIGKHATLSVEFNEGQPWQIDIILYDKPVLSSTSGTTSQFVIPVSYRGDMLATMEAVYEDGSNAGPQNWTSYKEFSYTFKPSYVNNTLTLTPNFFNEVNNGKVKLTLHFWSGEELEYWIMKNGSTVRGSLTQNFPSTPSTGTDNNLPSDDTTGGNNTDNENENGNGNENPPSEEVPQPVPASYSDIQSHWAYSAITRASIRGLINGYADGTFRPNAEISRAELVTIIGRALKLSSGQAAPSPFTDDAELPSFARSYINELAGLKVINGYEDGSFRPSSSMTRAEFAVIISRALQLEGTGLAQFSDQSSFPSWASNEIALVSELGLMQGKSSGQFAPNDTVTRAEAVTVLLRVITYLAEQK